MPLNISGSIVNSAIASTLNYKSIVTRGLVVSHDASILDSYPQSGTTWFDLTSNGNNATLTNGPVFNSSNGGNIQFDGTDDYSATTSVPASLQGDPNITVCGFFRRTEASISSAGIWGIGGETLDQGICCWNYSNTNEIAIDTWSRSTFTSGVTYPQNQWVFAAWQKTAGLMTRANCIIWRNLVSYTGTQLVILRAEGPAPSINNYGLTIGSISRNTTYCAGMDVGCLFIYNRILSSTEIAQNYNAQKDRFGI
jgi:hypothetical protein